MKLLFTYLICVCCHSVGFSQVNNKSNVALVSEKIDSLNQTGYDLWIRNPTQSVMNGEEAYRLATQINYQPGAALAKRISGVAHWALGEPKLALFDLYDGLTLYEELDDLEGISNLKLNIGMVYADIEEDSIATKLFTEAITGFTKLNLESRIATSYTKLGTLQLENAEYDDALNNFTNALSIHSKNNFEYGMAEAHNRLGRLYVDRKKLEQADYHLRQALSLSRKIDDKDGIISSTVQLGRLYTLRKEYQPAKDQFEQALQQANEKHLNNYKLEALQNLAQLEREINETDSAFIYYDEYTHLKDSVYNIQKSRQIAGLEFKNELFQKNQQLLLLAERQKTTKTIQWILVTGLIVISLLSYFLIKGLRKRTNIQEELLTQQELNTKQKIENEELKSKELLYELDAKNRELTSYAMNFVQKNQLLEELYEKVQTAKKDCSSKPTNKKLTEIEQVIMLHHSKEKGWEDFKQHFASVQPAFYPNLKKDFPDLSANDLKVATLTRMNLSIKEAANILGISPESTKTARYRLRKKLNLESETDLFEFLLDY